MSRMRPILSLALILLLVVATTVAASPKANDAGSGADAGEGAADATPLDSGGEYSGELRPHDADAYRLSTGPACVAFAPRGEPGLAFTVRGEGPGADLQARRVGGEGATLLVDEAALVLVERTTKAQRPMAYGFAIDARSASEFAAVGDGGLAGDAGDTAATGRAASGCFGGSVGGADAADVYLFEAVAGERAYAATSGAPAILTAPDGSVLATLTPGEADGIALPATGTYALTFAAAASGSAVVEYLAAIDVGPPDPSACRPTCLATS